MPAKYGHLKCIIVFLLAVTYSSFANGWEQKSELPTWRIGSATAVVDGKIYLIGGRIYTKKSGVGVEALSMVEVYDTESNTWHRAPDMPSRRSGARAAVVHGKIYVFGGSNEIKVRGINWKKNVEVYDPFTDTWQRKGDMPRFWNFGTAVVDGKVYAIGGTVFNKFQRKPEVTDIIEVYDPKTDTWTPHGKMPAQPRRQSFHTEVVNDNIYLIGGRDQDLARLGNGSFLMSIEEYNPRTRHWRQISELPFPRIVFSTVSIADHIYVVGGIDLRPNRNRYLASVDVYTPRTNRWSQIPAMPIGKTPGAAASNGKIFILGAFGPEYSPIVESFDTGFRPVSPKGKLSTTWADIKRAN